jgi:RHS repeat-associated protein
VYGDVSKPIFDDSLLMGFHFDEASGGTVADYAVDPAMGAHFGTLVGDVGWTDGFVFDPGDSAGALHLGSSGGYVATDNLDSSTLSFAAWVKMDGGSTSNTPIIMAEQSGGWGVGCGTYYYYYDPMLYFTQTDGDTIYSNFEIADGQWHFITVTYDPGAGESGEVVFYVDGQQEKNYYQDPVTHPCDWTFDSSSGDYRIGGPYAGEAYQEYGNSVQGYFDGSMDELGVWDRALTGGEIEGLYNSGRGVYGDTSQAPFNNNHLLVGYHFSESGSATQTADYSGHNNTGALAGDAGWATGRVRAPGETVSLEFDASGGSCVEVANLDYNEFSVSLTDSLTFAAWVKMDGGTTSNTPIIMAEQSGGWGIGCGDYNARLYFTQTDGDTIYSNFEIADGQWHFITVTYDPEAGESGEVIFYVDGEQEKNDQDPFTHPCDWTFDSSGGDYRIGGPYAGENYQYMMSDQGYYDGAMDEMAVWNRALSGGEIADLYGVSGGGVYGNPENEPFNEGLVALWHMDEGEGTTIADSSGNGRVGLLQGDFAWTLGRVTANGPTSNRLSPRFDNTRLYCGYALDAETGDYHVGYRQYSVSYSTWEQMDPIATPNAYEYCYDRPLFYVDFTGLAGQQIDPVKGVQKDPSCKDVCGPDVTEWFYNDLIKQLAFVQAASSGEAYELRFFATAKYGFSYKWLNFSIPGTTCATGKCNDTVMLADICVRKNVLGNIAFGALTAAAAKIRNPAADVRTAYNGAFPASPTDTYRQPSSLAGVHRADNLAAFSVGDYLTNPGTQYRGPSPMENLAAFIIAIKKAMTGDGLNTYAFLYEFSGPARAFTLDTLTFTAPPAPNVPFNTQSCKPCLDASNKPCKYNGESATKQVFDLFHEYEKTVFLWIPNDIGFDNWLRKYREGY